MKKATALLLTFALIASICLPPAAADDEPVFTDKVAGFVDTVKITGQDTLVIDWQLMANKTGVVLTNVQSISLTYDNTVLQLARWDAADVITPRSLDRFSETVVGVANNSGNHKDEEGENVPMRVYAAQSEDEAKGFLSFNMVSEIGRTLWPHGSFISLGRARFVFREGKTEDDLDPDSIRLMSVAEMNLTNQRYGVFHIADDNGIFGMFIHRDQTGGVLISEGDLDPPIFDYPHSVAATPTPTPTPEQDVEITIEYYFDGVIDEGETIIIKEKTVEPGKWLVPSDFEDSNFAEDRYPGYELDHVKVNGTVVIHRGPGGQWINEMPEKLEDGDVVLVYYISPGPSPSPTTAPATPTPTNTPTPTLTNTPTPTPTNTPTPMSTPYPAARITMTVEKLLFAKWCADAGIDPGAIVGDMVFKAYAVAGDGAPYSEPPDAIGEIDRNGQITFDTGSFTQGWYAIAETFTVGSLAGTLFGTPDVLYVYFDGVKFAGSNVNGFDYNGDYWITDAFFDRSVKPSLAITFRVNNGMPVTNPFFDDFFVREYFGPGNYGKSFISFCGNHAVVSLGGNAQIKYVNKTAIFSELHPGALDNILIAFNYINDTWGSLDRWPKAGIDNPMGSTKFIAQIAVWLLADIGVTEAKSATSGYWFINKYVDEVVEFVRKNPGHIGSGNVSDVVYLDHADYPPIDGECQPQIVPIYGGVTFDNKVATPMPTAVPTATPTALRPRQRQCLRSFLHPRPRLCRRQRQRQRQRLRNSLHPRPRLCRRQRQPRRLRRRPRQP